LQQEAQVGLILQEGQGLAYSVQERVQEIERGCATEKAIVEAVVGAVFEPGQLLCLLLVKTERL
jgi:hypothetical protein